MRQVMLGALFLGLALLLEVTASGWSLFQSVRLDFVFVVVVVWTWARGGRQGILIGWIGGFLIDVLFFPFWGVSAFSYTVSAFAVGLVRDRIYRENLFLLLVLVAGLTAGSALLSGAWLTLWGYGSLVGNVDQTMASRVLLNCLAVFVVMVTRETLPRRRLA